MLQTPLQKVFVGGRSRFIKLHLEKPLHLQHS